MAREATGWDHPDIPLGRCPGVHTPEKRALWHAAYTAAGMPDERRPETEMTDGRLLIRVRAAETARANLPTAVHDAQRERHHAADAAHRDAVLARAAGRALDADTHALAANEHAAAAQRLDQVATARGDALIAHAETFAAGEAARAELTRRGQDIGHEHDRTTAGDYLDWAAAEAAAREADDTHRAVTEHDLHDTLHHQAAAERATTDRNVEPDLPVPELPAQRSVPQRPAEVLTAAAAASEIDAAAAHAAAVTDQLTDQASHDAGTDAGLDAAEVDDDWHRARVAEQDAAERNIGSMEAIAATERRRAMKPSPPTVSRGGPDVGIGR